MNYINVTFSFQPLHPWTDILVAYLSEINFDSFEEQTYGINAYISKSDFDRYKIQAICDALECQIDFQCHEVQQDNWNAKWESSFEPIIIDHFCGIRANFHSPLEVDYELVITPKMSFGTGHHSTTAGIIKAMRTLDMKQQNVLDMGCGTGVLAILAEKMGAKSVLAIDIDDWAFRNAQENIRQNNSQCIHLKKGGSDAIEGNFDIILANINRNILLNDLGTYSSHLNSQGTILLSGFYDTDLEILTQEAHKHSLDYHSHFSHKQWTVAHFTKP